MDQPKKKPVDFTGQSKPQAGIFEKSGFSSTQPNISEQVSNPEPVDKIKREDFPDPFKQQQDMIRHTQNLVKSKENESTEEEQVNKLNEALDGNQNKTADQIIKINPEDMKIAEQLIFNGYAEIQVEIKRFPGRKFTICSTNAEELGLIDEIIFDKLKSVKQNDDGSVDLPDNTVRALRYALFLALSYKGVDGKDIASEPICHINTLKKAILKLGELYAAGEIKKADDFKSQIKTQLSKRAIIVRRMPTALMDYIAGEKYNFDAKMIKIMNEKEVIPLS